LLLNRWPDFWLDRTPQKPVQLTLNPTYCSAILPAAEPFASVRIPSTNWKTNGIYLFSIQVAKTQELNFR